MSDKILHYIKAFLFKNPFFMFLANFIFAISYLKIHCCLSKYFESSDVIAVKKISLLKIH